MYLVEEMYLKYPYFILSHIISTMIIFSDHFPKNKLPIMKFFSIAILFGWDNQAFQFAVSVCYFLTAFAVFLYKIGSAKSAQHTLRIGYKSKQ